MNSVEPRDELSRYNGDDTCLVTCWPSDLDGYQDFSYYTKNSVVRVSKDLQWLASVHDTTGHSCNNEVVLSNDTREELTELQPFSLYSIQVRSYAGQIRLLRDLTCCSTGEGNDSGRVWTTEYLSSCPNGTFAYEIRLV